MPRLLRRKLTCFYCGEKSTNSHTGRVSSWQCTNCEAVNYLDENGEITDPPEQSFASPNTRSVRYAQPVPRATSPELSFNGDDLFCRTCQNNQHIVNQALAEYLPPSNDPQYADYESSVEVFRKGLEERYPQVCADCVPRVRDRIRRTGYQAKADHMRRMLQKTRQGGIATAQAGWTWRKMVVLLGGQLYFWSIVLGLMWHTVGLLMRPEDGLQEVETLGVHSCFRQAATDKEVEQACFDFMHPLAQYAIVCGVLSIWWNNKLMEKINGRGRRMHGLGTHLTLQIFVLAARLASMWYLSEVQPIQNALQAFQGGHLFMLIFILISTVISLRVVKIEYPPAFSFNETIEPLLPSVPVDQNGAEIRRPVRSSLDTMAESFDTSFPISKLAEPSAAIQYPPSPTMTATSSATSYNDTTTSDYSLLDPENSMDWTPTRETTFNPNRPVTRFGNFTQPPPVQRSPGQTPFHGTIPAAPKAPAHKILNPFPQPVFKRASLTSQADFFSKMMVSQGSLESNSRLGSEVAKPPKEEIVFQGAKLKFQDEQPSTGLEGMFDAVFSSVKHAPYERPVPQMQEEGNATQKVVTLPPVQEVDESGWWGTGQLVLISCLPILVGVGICLRNGWY